MKRSLLSFLALSSLSLGGCAVLSGAPSSSTGSTGTVNASAYETMESLPPEPRREDVPKLAEKEVWVPGYYQPVAGSWVWHQGQVMTAKDGYALLPASYREESGKVFFSPPRWRRADLAQDRAAK